MFIGQLRSALYAGMIITYAQGMALLVVASAKHEYDLNLEAVARIWRGGCIIRAALLEDFRAAFHVKPGLPNLLLDPKLSQKVNGSSGKPAQDGLPRERSGYSRARPDGFARVSRQLPQWVAAG